MREVSERIREVEARIQQARQAAPKGAGAAMDLGNWKEMDAIWATYFTQEPKPARATVRAELVAPWLFEMQATAYI